jgi:hypothetical protein
VPLLNGRMRTACNVAVRLSHSRRRRCASRNATGGFSTHIHGRHHVDYLVGYRIGECVEQKQARWSSR